MCRRKRGYQQIRGLIFPVQGESTAERTDGAAAIGGIIAVLAGGGGAGIGAGTGRTWARVLKFIAKGDEVKILSEMLLEFTLQQSVTIQKQAT